MTVKKVATITRHLGLSTDTKPTSVAPGSTFYEYDTKLLYITYDDGSNWTIKSIPYGLIFAGTCNSGMTASTITVACADLAGYGNDYFNGKGGLFYVQIIKNADDPTAAPGGEIRLITDYVTATGTFTVDAFSANVQESDEVWVVHRSVMLMLTETPTIGEWVLGDADDFNVADADADNERWDSGYVSGTEGGSANIDTTTNDKLMVKVDPDATPSAAQYAVTHNLPLYADYFQVIADLNCTWGAGASVAAKWVGMFITKTTSYDGNNYIGVMRQKGTAIDRISVSYNLNGAGVTQTNVAVTDDVLAFKIERWDETYRIFYSTAQSPNYDWVLITQIEDPNNYLTNQIGLLFTAYSPGTLDTESVQGDFGTFRYWLGTGGGSQYIAGDYDSSWVVADSDGNVLERQEFVQNQNALQYMGVCSASVDTTHTTAAQLIGYGTNYFANDYWMRVEYTTDAAAPLGEMKKISAYVTATGAFTHAAFSVAVDASDKVAVLHRSQLLLLQTAAADMTAEVVDGSVLSRVITSDADTSGYNLADDSLEAIADKQGASAQLTDPTDPSWDDVNKWWEGNQLALLQKILMYLGAGDGANNVEITEDVSLPYIIRYLYNLADGASVTLDKVVATSIICKLASKGALGGSGATYNNTTDSLEAIADSINGATGILHEQADTPLTYNTDDTEDTALSLATADTRYILRSLWLKFADPGANTITVRLKLLINDISTTVDTFSVTTANFGTYFSLMDMFGQQQVAGDSIIVTTQNSAVAIVAVTGQYSYSKTNV